MTRILNIFDNLSDADTDLAERTRCGAGIACRFVGYKMEMNELKMDGDIEKNNTYLDLLIGFKRRDQQDYTRWHIGSQTKLTIWFEDNTVKHFYRRKYTSSADYRMAIYEYFRKYIENGYDIRPRLEVMPEVEFMDI